MAWNRGTYGLETEFGGNSPPLWPRLCGLVVLIAVAVLGVRACRSVDRETLERRRALPMVGTESAPATESQAQQAARIDKFPAALRKQLLQAEELAGKGEEAAALDRYLALLREASSDAVREELEDRIGVLSVALAVSRLPMPGKVGYTIQSGDAVSTIARRFGVTQEYILRANELTDPNRIVVGRELRVLDNPAFTITVSKRARTLVMTLNGRFFKRYAVSVGRATDTPEGTFVIRNRIVNPSWWRADGSEIPYGHAENILGTRWLALSAVGDTTPVRGYGIHGTWEDGAVGLTPSAGCIRMRNADVEEIHLLVPIGTPVVIGP